MRPRVAVLAFALAIPGCTGQRDATPPVEALRGPAVVAESFVTPLDSIDNVDGPAVYHGRNGEHWLIATGKDSDALVVYEATTGVLIRRVGGTGTGNGQLDRPNGIIILGDSLLLVVERDNARVQGFRLPSFQSVGAFGQGLLRLPYGIAAVAESSSYVVYVTDNYEAADESVPPDRELGARVKQFRVHLASPRIRADHVRDFGDTTGAGVIRIAESIAADPAHNRLLIAEETETDSHIKVYDLDGKFTGRVLGRGHFPQQAEGIALYTCADRGGYWITTDQGDSINTFHVFDRVTLEHVGAFTGTRTRRTDGVALTQRAFGPFRAGAFFGSHIDAGVGALSWADIAGALKLRADCAG